MANSEIQAQGQAFGQRPEAARESFFLLPSKNVPVPKANLNS